MSNALRRRLASLFVLAALVFSGFLATASPALADDPALPAVSVADADSMTHSGDSLTPTASADGLDPDLALQKIDLSLQQVARNGEKGFSDVMIYTTDMPELGAALEAVGARRAVMIDGEPRVVPFSARSWGAVGTLTSINIQVPNRALIEIASLSGVDSIQERGQYAPAIIRDEVTLEERTRFLDVREQIRNGEFRTPPALAGQTGGGSISPTSWAIAREHNALDVWRDLGYDGSGVNVAVIDTGEDFGHPSLNGQWAVDTNPASPYFGWPIMFHPASMEGLFGAGWWTAPSDLDRLPLPYWLSVNDGDVWYSNTDFRANDSDLDGFLRYANGVADPVSGLPQITPRVNPQQYGNFGGNAQSRINRNYWVGQPGDIGQIISASGLYRIGVNRDDTLTGLYGEKVGLLLVDSTTPGVYDTVYVDLNFNFDFTDDKAVTRADPISVADLTGDGVPDVSGGLLYFIASSTTVTGETVIASITGSESSASLANTGVAVDVTGHWMFEPIGLTLQSGITSLYLPGATEDIIEEFSMGGGDETNTVWQLGTAQTVFGPMTIDFGDFLYGTFDGRAVDSARLLRGPNTDFSIGMIYDISNSTGGLVAGVDYSIDTATGEITWLHDFPNGDWVDIIYQLDSYTLDAGAGVVNFNAALPAGWTLLADYDAGLPIPYSDVYAATHGYDLFVPGNGDLVAFHGEFDWGQSHGSFVSSTVAARPFGNLASPFFEVFGTAPGANIIGIAACCNVPGPVGLFGSIEDQRTFAALGYDGLPNTGDEAQIISNSFGSTQTVNTGFSFEDRWLYDFTATYPTVTTLIAFGNNGAGYATGAPGGTSPGVVTVGAGTSGDYRVLYGFDAGEGNYEFPFCPGPPPYDPANCIGIGAGSGDGPGPFGEHAYFSSRGPTLLGQPKPDVVSIGSFAVEAGPLNVYCFDVPAFCDGNFAFDIFSGTSQATPVTSGVVALGVEAYRATHGGANPTNDQVKTALKAGADDMHRDILQQGAGWTNALRTARIMAEMDGVTPSRNFWVPGNYQGLARPAFVNFVSAAGSDSTSITVTNHHPTLAKNVAITNEVYARMTAPYTWSVSLGTGSGRLYILKPDGIYAIDGATLLQAEPWAAQWNTADFAKITWTYDATAYMGPDGLPNSGDESTSLRLDIFDWYDYQHPVGLTIGTYDGGGWEEFVASAPSTAYTGQVVGTGVFGETKAMLFDSTVQGWVAAPYSFSRDSVGVMTEVAVCSGVTATEYILDTVNGWLNLCAPLLDGENVTGDYTVYDLVLAGDSFFLANTAVVPGSETVYLNGAVWAPANYAITYATGEFVFNTPLSADDVVEVDYVWDNAGIYDGFLERNRMTVAVFGGNANSVHESFGLLPSKIHDGLVLNPRSGALAAIPATLIVEFYEKVDWTWVTTSVPSLNIAAAGNTASFNVNLNVPAGTAPGLYEGAVYLQDGTMTTTIPIVVNVPTTTFPVLLGGNVPTTSLYDNNGVIQGARSGWRQIGDTRYVFADINVVDAPGRRMIYNAILQGRRSDPDMLVFSCVPDPDGYTADATYGPCRMSLLSRSKELVGATDTLFPNKEFMHSSAVSGLIGFQLKAYGSSGQDGGSERLEANIGIMQATLSGPGNPLGATEISTATNRLSGSVPMTVWSNVPMYGGVGSAVTEVVVTQWPNLPVDSYPYPGGDFIQYLFNAPNKQRTDIAANTISATWSGQFFNGDDVDYGVFQDTNCDGVYTTANSFSGSAMGTSANPETFTAGFPPQGCYWVHIAGFTAVTGSTTTTITLSVNRIGVSPFSTVNAPTTDVAPNTPVLAGIGWTFPLSQPEGPVSGLLFVSPGYAPFALAIGMTLRVRYDTTPVTVQDFAPLPGSTTNDRTASVVANVYDTAVRMIDINSARLWIDGLEVTQNMRKLPTFTSAVACCYNLLTVAYDSPTPYSDGPHSAVLEVADIAGNVGRASWSWTVDSMPPVVTLSDPMGDGVTNVAAQPVIGMAPSAVSLTVNGNAVPVDSITGAFSTSLTLLAGANAIEVTATDAAGNAATVARTVTLDMDDPVLLNVRSSEPSKTSADSTEISGTVNEEVTGVTVEGLNVAVRADGSFAVRMPLAEGSNTFDVSATDLAGNTASVPVTVTRDTAAPTITLGPIPATITSLDQSTVNISGVVGGTDLSLVTVNGIAVPTTLGIFIREFPLSLGSNVFVVEATDDVGNRATATTSVTWSPVVQNIQRNWNSVILMGVAVVLLIVGFAVGWMLASSRAPPPAPMAPPMEAPRAEERRAPEPEEIPAEEEMTTEEEEL